MPARLHRYRVGLVWTGNDGSGTSSYQDYGRSHRLHAAGKPSISGSADPAFRGESQRWTPEELLVGSLSACHQLWYLHLCADAGLVVVAYEDHADGFMTEEAGGAGQFERVVLRPWVTLAPGSDVERALALHRAAGAACFIARSVNFPVLCEPQATCVAVSNC